jgi:hypothetical protein
MGGARHESAKLRVTMAEAAEILGVSVEAAKMIATLREQVQAERKANEENRRIIAALTQRIPEIEAPREPRESPGLSDAPRGSPVLAENPGPSATTPSDPDEAPEKTAERPLWQRILGV